MTARRMISGEVLKYRNEFLIHRHYETCFAGSSQFALTRPWSLTTLREKLIKIGAKVVRHGRYVTFQLAEVAIPRSLFANILRLIDGLRPAPLPP